VTSEKRHCVLSTIGNLLKETYFESFVRIHRSFAVQKQFIEQREQGTHMIDVNTPPVTEIKF
jgi:DNA-binding LytR/AlgR family response regulator